MKNGALHTNTKAVKITNGLQAKTISLGVRFEFYVQTPNLKMFFGLNLRQTNANTTIVASDGIMSASSGPWNIVNNNCNPVYVPLTVKMTGKISLIPSYHL